MEQVVVNFITQHPGPFTIIISIIAVVLWLLFKLQKAVSTMWPFARKLVAVVDDLFGSEGRPGVPARPGLMERMAKSEAADVATAQTLADHSEALKELQPNHGGSMKDVLNSIHARIGTLETSLSEHIASVRAPEQTVVVQNTVAAPSPQETA